MKENFLTEVENQHVFPGNPQVSETFEEKGEFRPANQNPPFCNRREKALKAIYLADFKNISKGAVQSLVFSENFLKKL